MRIHWKGLWGQAQPRQRYRAFPKGLLNVWKAVLQKSIEMHYARTARIKTELLQDLRCLKRSPKNGRRNIRILQSMISGILLTLELEPERRILMFIWP